MQYAHRNDVFASVGVLHYVKDSVFYVVEGAPYYFIG
mgnify:CR=1 FL=1